MIKYWGYTRERYIRKGDIVGCFEDSTTSPSICGMIHALSDNATIRLRMAEVNFARSYEYKFKYGEDLKQIELVKVVPNRSRWFK